MGNVKILKASAGSGKTYRLAYEYIRSVIASPWLYRNILAVTFTNKATEEMKQRILREINALAGGAGGYTAALQADLGLTTGTIRARAAEARTKILHDYSHFTVITIDKFFQRIIRSFIKELGIDLNFNLELQTDSILESATDRLIEQIATDRKLRDWVIRFVEEKIDQSGRWDIRSEIASLGRELFREQYRTAKQDSAPKDELERIATEALGRSCRIEAQMKKTAADALKIISDAGLAIDDFAYGKQGCVSYFLKTASGGIDAYGKRVSDALGSEDKWVPARSPRRDDVKAVVPQLRKLLEQLCRTYDENIRFLNSARLLADNYRSFALLTDLSEKVAEICAEQNLVPISETNAILGKLIAGNDTPFIYEKVGNAFSRYMIDEFQDTSQQQWQNFIPLLENALSQADDAPVLLVGDVKQSIYRWRGGDWQILGQRVQQQFGSAQQSTLDTNYRSAGVIVDFNNSMIGECVRLDNDNLNAWLDEATSQGSLSSRQKAGLQDMLQSAYADQRQKCSKPSQAGYVRISEYVADMTNEAGESPVIETIGELQRRGYAAGDIAVLVRTNPQGSAIASELLDYKAAHPESPYCYDVVTQEALQIGNSATIGFITAVLKLSATGVDPIRRAIYNRFLGNRLDAALPEAEAEFILGLRLQSIEEAFEEIVLHYDLNRNPQDIAYLQALQEQVHTFSTSKIADIPLFMKWWDETGHRESISLPLNRNAINITTIHKSKGLQYKAVIIPYCNWSLLPKTGSLLWAQGTEAPFDGLGYFPVKWGKALGNSAFSETYCREMVLSHIDNVNLFYVAATRAEQELHIIIPRGGNDGAQRISGLILGSVQTTPSGNVTIGGLTGAMAETESGPVFTFGHPSGPAERVTPPARPATAFPSRRIGTRLKLRFGSERYFEDSDSMPVLSPRNYGIIMHKLFENLTELTELDPALQAMLSNGSISGKEADKVGELLAAALDDPTIRSWFDKGWSVVRNENDIIVPGSSSVRRPDRVVTKGSEAVVVDYKFGLQKQKKHIRQIEEYMQLIRRMGYRTVRGYLWYVERQEVEQVAG